MSYSGDNQIVGLVYINYRRLPFRFNRKTMQLELVFRYFIQFLGYTFLFINTYAVLCIDFRWKNSYIQNDLCLV